MPLLAAANTLLILRVRALYGQAKVIPLLLCGLMLSQIAAGMWIYLQPGKTVIVPPPTTSSVFIECINLPNPALGSKSAIYLFLETAFDSAVFLLTSYKTYSEVLVGGRSRVRAILARDGVFYYGVIFASCLTWALMVLFAPTDLQYINAIPTNCLTAIMVCRITLNLREAGNTKHGWVNEPTFSLSTLQFSRLSGWPPMSHGQSHTLSLSEGRASEMPLAPGGAELMLGSGGEIEMDRLRPLPPPPRWQPHSGKNPYLHPPLDLKEQQYGLKESYSNPRTYEYPQPPPLPEKNPNRTRRMNPES